MQKVRWFIGIALMMLIVAPLWAQEKDPSLKEVSYKQSGLAYPGSHLFNLDTNTSYVEYLTLETQREGITINGLAKRTFFVEIVKSETSLHEWARDYIRVEFLEPEDVAGDVFILESFRGEDALYFWNPELLSPLILDDSFEFFGDMPVRFFLSTTFPQFYSRVLGDMDTYPDSSHISQPETLEEKLFIGKQIRLIERNYEVLREHADQVKFSKVRTVFYNLVLSYTTVYMDANGNFLKEIRHDDWRKSAPALRQDGSFTGLYYATETLYVDHVIPNHETLSIIDEVGFEQVEQSQFDPDLLGE